MPIFSILRGVENAVVFAVSSVLVASRLVVELIVLPVLLFSRSVSFGVSRSSLLCSLLRHASPVFRAVVFRRFIYSAPLPGQRLTRRSSGTPQKRVAPQLYVRRYANHANFFCIARCRKCGGFCCEFCFGRIPFGG